MKTCSSVIPGGGDCCNNIYSGTCPIVTNKSKNCVGITSHVDAKKDFAEGLAWIQVATEAKETGVKHTRSTGWKMSTRT